jgi:vacuolar-type H+-ATPase subunit I/STV1
VSKIRQAVNYEREIAKREVNAHRELVDQSIDYERRLSDQALASQVAIRDAALAYERQITNSQFETLAALNNEHREFHEREHILTDTAIDKATSSLLSEMSSLRRDIEALETSSHQLMSVGRFEREHAALIERVDAKFENYDEKIIAEEKVTVRQDATSALMEKIAQNNRWMVGILITLGIFAATTLLHIYGII